MDQVNFYLLVQKYIIFGVSFCMASEAFDYDFLDIMEDLDFLRASSPPVKLNMDKTSKFDLH